MSEKPEALRLAENLVNQWYGLMASDSGLPGVSPVIVGALRLDAAAELRRLHAENERLRAAGEKLFRKWSNAAPYHQWEPEMFEMELALYPPKQENKK